jgi:phytoene dehydrogenase-like protein
MLRPRLVRVVPDAVVVGAGPNGLVAANQLVDRGWSVAVLEAESEPGGAVRSGQLTVPGFTHDLFSAFYPLALASPAMRGLRLHEHGLRWRHAPVVLAHPLPDGRAAFLSRDMDATAANLDTFHRGDGEAWVAMIEEWDRIAEPLLDAFLGPFPPARAVGQLTRRIGPKGMLRLARHLLLPVRRLQEERFRGEGGGLLLGGSALHADLCPEGAGSGLYGWLLCCLGQRFGFPVPEGGAGGLTRALVSRLLTSGGEVVCNTRVRRIVIRGGRAVAVQTDEGTTIDANRAVIADVPAPALYRDLVGEHNLPPGLLRDLKNFQWDTATVKVDWALSAPVPWANAEAVEAGTIHVAESFDEFSEFAAHLAMRQLPARPFLLFGQQSRADPSRSPPGTETAWAYTHVPRNVRADSAGKIPIGGEAEVERWLGPFVERMESRVERLAPGFRGLILARHVFGPSDLEQADANLYGGAIGGGTAQLHQQLLFRPVPGLGRPETPVERLFLASSSAHPGGGVHGAAGANAARAAANAARAAAAGLGRTRHLLLGSIPYKG